MERRLFQTPLISTMARCTTTNSTLPPAENLKQEGIAGVHSGRHGESGRQHQGQKHERHDEIGKLLEHVVPLGLFSLRKSEPQMLPDRRANVFQLAAARREVLAEVPAREAVDEISEPVDDEEPGEEEMPAPSRRQIAMAG